jgi:heat shock protein HspQ
VKPAAIEIGSRVIKRGFPHVGVVVDIKGAWASINWILGKAARERPLICHVSELARHIGEES